MAGTIFYSWQNDLDHKTHRNFIEKCIQKALKSVKKEAHVVVDYDRDIKGLNGSPDITATIFDKIEKSVLFICDVSIINQESNQRKSPNPNVLIELGFAIHKLGWDRIICFFDSNTGDVEELPFDIRQKRVTVFNPNAENEVERITKILATNIQDLYVDGKLFNPLNDYMKGRIDHSILSIAKQMANLVFGTTTMSEGLAHVDDLLHLQPNKCSEYLRQVQFPAFIVLNTFSEAEDNLKLILRELFSSSYFPKEWAYTVLELLEWIREYNYLISKRNRDYPLIQIEGKEFTNIAAIDGKSINPRNPQNSFLILERVTKDGKQYVDTTGGKVINTTQYPTNNAPSLRKCYAIKEASVTAFTETIYRLISICNSWLDITNEEFILDPDHYWIG